MFGELIGVWAAAVWQSMGEPAVDHRRARAWARHADGRRAARVRAACPDCSPASVALVETSPAARDAKRVARRLPRPAQLCESIEDVPQGPLILIANEFIDALPVRQIVREGGAWRERCVTLDATGAFAFCAGAPAEHRRLPQSLQRHRRGRWRDRRDASRGRDPVSALAARAKTRPLPRCSPITAMPRAGSAIRCKRSAAIASPIRSPRPGEADLTAHVDFAALKAAAASLASPPMDPCRKANFCSSLVLERAASGCCAMRRPSRRRRFCQAPPGLPIRARWGFSSKCSRCNRAGLPRRLPSETFDVRFRTPWSHQTK